MDTDEGDDDGTRTHGPGIDRRRGSAEWNWAVLLVRYQPTAVEAVDVGDDNPAIRPDDDDGVLEATDEGDDDTPTGADAPTGAVDGVEGDGDDTTGDDGTGGGDNTGDGDSTARR